MCMTRPEKTLPGNESIVKSSPCPTRKAAERAEGTATVSSSRRLSTMRNIGAPLPMFSTRSPTLTDRSATVPVIGARITAFAHRVSAAASSAAAACAAAAAASDAERASSRLCWVTRPWSLSFTARSSSRLARVAATSACSAIAAAARRAASASRVSSRASGAPLSTCTHCVTYTSATTAVNSDFTSAKNFGSSVPTTSIAWVRVVGAALATSTATAGLPPSASFPSPLFEQPDTASARIRVAVAAVINVLIAKTPLPGRKQTPSNTTWTRRARRARPNSISGWHRLIPRATSNGPTSAHATSSGSPGRNSPAAIPSRTRPANVSMNRWWIVSKSKNGAPCGGP